METSPYSHSCSRPSSDGTTEVSVQPSCEAVPSREEHARGRADWAVWDAVNGVLTFMTDGPRSAANRSRRWSTSLQRGVKGVRPPPERRPVTPEVAGSSPVAPVSKNACKTRASVALSDGISGSEHRRLLPDGIPLHRSFGLNHLQNTQLSARAF